MSSGARRRVAGLAAAFAAALAAATPAFAQGYPSKPIRIVVPFTPGGFNDTLGRILAQRFQETWGQAGVVENRPGGGTVIGTEAAARAAPDGHTLLVVALPFSVIPALYPAAKFDILKDFAPVVLAGATPNILVVHPSVGANTVQELVALARSKPGAITYASSGSGTSNHLAAEMFRAMTGTNFVHIPYKGSAPALTDIIGGQVALIFDNAPNVLPHVRAGKLRALAVTSSRRSSFAPDIPTVAESGVPGYEITGWFGVVAPAGTPPEIVERLNGEINRLLAQADTRDRFLKAGVEPIGGTAAAFGAHLRSEAAKWARVVKESGARVE